MKIIKVLGIERKERYWGSCHNVKQEKVFQNFWMSKPSLSGEKHPDCWPTEQSADTQGVSPRQGSTPLKELYHD